MALPPNIFSAVMTAMHAGSLVLVPNHRMHVQLLDNYGPWRQANGFPPVCPTPDVHPVDIWLRQQWLDSPATLASETSQILEPALETLAWQDIVRDSEAGAGLVNQRATARSVQEAWRLAHLWRIDMNAVRKLGFYQKNERPQDDLAAFLSWVDTFETFCRNKSLISQSPMVEAVIARLSAGQLAVPDQIVLAGFGNPPPLYAALIEALKKSCANVSEFALPGQSPHIRVQECRDSDDEIQRAASWAREVLAQDPDARIGIICPELHRLQPVLQRHFRALLHPGKPGDAPLFSLSANPDLTASPMLATAMDILALNTQWVDILHLCRLLRSPFIAGALSEEGGRANLERRLRDTGEMKVQLVWIRELAADAESACHCQALATGLLDFETRRRTFPGHAHLHQWSTLFEAQLSVLGWPGARTPDREEAGQLQAWSRVLKAFTLLSHWHGKVNLDRALAILNQIMAGASAGSNDDFAPVQILTPTEADGLAFTHIRMLGLTEQQWPPPTRPAPFIPLGLQKAANMPDCDIRQVTASALRQLQEFVAHTCSEIVFSYPCQEEDLALKPTGMLSKFVTSAAGQIAADSHVEKIPVTDLSVILEEDPYLPPPEGEILSGGISLLADQADCPFRAFAIHRLRAEPLNAPVIGLPGHVLGSILHDALDMFWQTLKDQVHLLEGNQEILEQAVVDAATSAVMNKARFYRHTMTARFNAMEISRLKGLLMDWLDEERKRGSFRVAASEYRLQWQHANLNLNLRIDRVDETPERKRIIVDYKSPKHAEISWFDTRQTEPQLMLYMLAVEASGAGEVDGVFIAQVNVEEMKYKGISNDDSIYPRSHFSNKREVPGDLAWDQIKQSWRDSMTMLANEFLSGYAAVEPKSVSSSCTWCHLGAFCRINDEVGA